MGESWVTNGTEFPVDEETEAEREERYARIIHVQFGPNCEPAFDQLPEGRRRLYIDVARAVLYAQHFGSSGGAS